MKVHQLGLWVLYAKFVNKIFWYRSWRQKICTAIKFWKTISIALRWYLGSTLPDRASFEISLTKIVPKDFAEESRPDVVSSQFLL